MKKTNSAIKRRLYGALAGLLSLTLLAGCVEINQGVNPATPADAEEEYIEEGTDTRIEITGYGAWLGEPEGYFLNAGDKIAVISPSALPSREQTDAVLEGLRSWGYEPVEGQYVCPKERTLEECLEDLTWALTDPEIRAVFCVRGGYGASEVTDAIPEAEELIASAKKPILGYSDITVYNGAWTMAGLPSLHACMSGTFMGLPEECQEAERHMLKGELPVYRVEADAYAAEGSAEGILIGGNLSTFTATLGTAYDCTRLEEPYILFLEEVGENMQHIHRYLTILKHLGVLDQAAGIVFGEWTELPANGDGNYGDARGGRFASVADMIRRQILPDPDIPVVFGFPMGHGDAAYPLLMGAKARLEARDGYYTISWTETKPIELPDETGTATPADFPKDNTGTAAPLDAAEHHSWIAGADNTAEGVEGAAFAAAAALAADNALRLATPGSFSDGAVPVETPDDQDILVLFTSDVHCGIDQNFGYGGLQAVRDAAAAKGNHVLLVDNGDSVQGESIGTLTRGEADIRLMNRLHYDAAIPGNHEFDYGMDQFFKLADMAEFPYISCNFRKAGELVFPPYLIREVNGIKIAFVGITTPQTITSSTPKFFQNENGEFIYDFMQDDTGEKLYAGVQQAVDDARAEGAQYVIALAHLGCFSTSSPWTYADVVQHTNGIDAVLDGHSHDTDRIVMQNKDGEDVPRQACGTKLNAIGWLRIAASDGSLDTGLYTWENAVSAPELFGMENELTKAVAEENGALSDTLSEVIAKVPFDLTINDPEAVDDNGVPIRIIRRAETNLGDLCADAVRDQSGADIGFVNGGGIRTTIQAGDLTLKEILSVYPFSNKQAVIEATGQQILDALEWGSQAVPEQYGGFLQVSGLSYEIHTGIKSSCTRDADGMFTGVTGPYRVQNVMVGEEPLDPGKTYTVASVNYILFDHGNGYTMFDGCRVITDNGKLDNQVLIGYLTETLGGEIGEEYADPYGQGRIIAVED